MGRFIARRLLIAIVVLFGVSVVTFTAAKLAPGDPVLAFVKPGSDIRPSDLEALREQLGLNKPWIEQYGLWLGRLVSGNLGLTTLGGNVGEIIARRVPNTIKLMGFALIIAIVFGVLLGIFSAFRQGTKVDNVLTTVVFLGISLPSYLVALFAIFFISVQFKVLTGFVLFPPGGSADPNSKLPAWADEFWHILLPGLVLAFILTAIFLRYTRASVLEVMRQDHVTTARSKGLPERIVRFRHILRNALLPIVTVIALVLPALVTGALFVETLFRYPGIGLLAIDATKNREYNVIMAVAMLTAVAVVLSNLLADIVYAFVDPRIRYA